MAYKGRVLDCLSDPARRFFKDEFKKDSNEASLRKIEYLIMDIVRPYKIGMTVFMLCTLGLGTYLALNVTRVSKVNDQQASMIAEKKRMREEIDGLERKVVSLSTGQQSSARESTAGMENMAKLDMGMFFENLAYKADGGLITNDELVRLLKVAAAVDPVTTLQHIRGKQVYLSALSAADLAAITAKAGSK